MLEYIIFFIIWNKMFKLYHFYTIILLPGLVMTSPTISKTITSGIYTLTLYDDKQSYGSAALKCNEQQSRLVVLNDSNKKIILGYLNQLSSENAYFVHGRSVEMCTAIFKHGITTKHRNENNFYVCEKAQVDSVTLTDYNVTVPDKTTITCNASGYPTPLIVWKRNCVNVSTFTSESIYQTHLNGKSTLHLKNSKVTDEGEYNCLATNSYGDKTYTKWSKPANIRIPSKPTIESATGNSCNQSSLVIKWNPHFRAIGVEHKFILREPTSDKSKVIYSTPVGPRDALHSLSIADLTSENQFDITIQPCSSVEQCYQYKASKMLRIGGVPGLVLNAEIRKVNESCLVSWSPPHPVSSNVIIQYQLRIESSFAYAPPNTVTPSDNIMFVDASVLSYLIPKLPNRNYTTYIQAETCTDSGDATMTAGECVTDASAPAFIGQPKVDSSISDNGTLEIVLETPDESSGRISCVFVIAQLFNPTEKNEPIFKEDHFRKMNVLMTEKEYIAIAAERKKMNFTKSKHTFLLGDSTLSSCKLDTQDAKYRENQKSLPEDLYIGLNKKLKKDLSYKIYMVTATQSATEVFFQVSDALVVTGKADTQLDLFVIAFSVAGVMLVITLIIIVVLVKKISKMRQTLQFATTKNAKQENEAESHIPHPYEYPAINIRENTAQYIKPEGEPIRSEYEQVDHTASSSGQQSKAYENQNVNVHYELPQNPYELISK